VEESIDFNDINFYLNGFARMIFYTKKTVNTAPVKRAGEYRLDPESKKYVLIKDNQIYQKR